MRRQTRFAAWPRLRVLVRLQAQPVQAWPLVLVFPSQAWQAWPQRVRVLVRLQVQPVQCPPPTGSAPQKPPRAERRRQS